MSICASREVNIRRDFRSGTAAALAGGFTRVMAMPNTQPPLVTLERWQAVQQQAQREGLCDVDMFCGAVLDSKRELPALGRNAPALKVYLDSTYGLLKVENLEELRVIAAEWAEG